MLLLITASTLPQVVCNTLSAVHCADAVRLDNISFTHDVLSTNQSHSDVLLQSWTSSPNGRGTLDIIWSCHFTVFLCCWSVVCVNVPPPTWGNWRRVHAKFIAALMSGFGPEFTFQLALGQWSSARRSVAAFRKSGHSDWTMRHAFLADMGGFVLHASDWVEFPLDAKQLHYLVTHGFVSYSEDIRLPKHIIADKNKADGLIRLITVCQILWFCVNCFGRLAQNLCYHHNGGLSPLLHHVHRWYLGLMGIKTNGCRKCNCIGSQYHSRKHSY